MSKLWGGRFDQATHKDVELFTSSLAVDSRLWRADIQGSLAHAEMLGQTGILDLSEARQIIDGLIAVEADLDSGSSQIPFDAEDVHSAIETLLTNKIGPVAGKLHTARSRNDQVATTCRIYMKDQAKAFDKELSALQAYFIAQSELHKETVLPGLTHLQHGQPVSLAHHLLAYFWMFERNRGRLKDFYKRLNHLPLGSGALAGTTLPIDRDYVAKKLGFAGVCENSLDAVSDRDFALEFLSLASIVGTHLSRIAEELVIWSTPEFGFVTLSDAVTTGSSLMPQKKNPDVAELIRGRTGRLNGSLMGLLTVCKALPLSYNRDLQEDKVHLFEALDSVRASVRLTLLMLQNAKWSTEKMAAACRGDQSNATDLADYLVKKGVPFRQTHEIAGSAVKFALKKGVGLEELTLAELKGFHSSFEDDVYEKIDLLNIMKSRNSRGGTGTKAVQDQISRAKKAWEAMNEND